MTLLRRIWHLLRRSRHDADLREEMETHRRLRQARIERDGVEPTEADAGSRRALGNAALARDEARDVWAFPAAAGLWQDTRHAACALARRPLLTTTAARYNESTVTA